MQQTYHILSYQHVALGTKEKFVPFWRLFSTQYEAYTGKKYKETPMELFKQTLLFAESANAITAKHKKALEVLRNG